MTPFIFSEYLKNPLSMCAKVVATSKGKSGHSTNTASHEIQAIISKAVMAKHPNVVFYKTLPEAIANRGGILDYQGTLILCDTAEIVLHKLTSSDDPKKKFTDMCFQMIPSVLMLVAEIRGNNPTGAVPHIVCKAVSLNHDEPVDHQQVGLHEMVGETALFQVTNGETVQYFSSSAGKETSSSQSKKLALRQGFNSLAHFDSLLTEAEKCLSDCKSGMFPSIFKCDTKTFTIDDIRAFYDNPAIIASIKDDIEKAGGEPRLFVDNPENTFLALKDFRISSLPKEMGHAAFFAPAEDIAFSVGWTDVWKCALNELNENVPFKVLKPQELIDFVGKVEACDSGKNTYHLDFETISPFMLSLVCNGRKACINQDIPFSFAITKDNADGTASSHTFVIEPGDFHKNDPREVIATALCGILNGHKGAILGYNTATTEQAILLSLAKHCDSAGMVEEASVLSSAAARVYDIYEVFRKNIIVVKQLPVASLSLKRTVEFAMPTNPYTELAAKDLISSGTDASQRYHDIVKESNTYIGEKLPSSVEDRASALVDEIKTYNATDTEATHALYMLFTAQANLCSKVDKPIDSLLCQSPRPLGRDLCRETQHKS